MRSLLNVVFKAALLCALPLGLGFSAELSEAQTRKPAANSSTRCKRQ
ncbi:hypothetical protein SAMN05444158_2855 [Bradyrhizobium canariense]|uniref:Uncharacterized protein n=1 Tax=Bradyrhizobium canariense TaxID=255045 RepID=A0A1H1U822_9BRAD|nr:hypothetical protein SAMN05444158_2855 [Bradyrhizobium canariense]